MPQKDILMLLCLAQQILTVEQRSSKNKQERDEGSEEGGGQEKEKTAIKDYLWWCRKAQRWLHSSSPSASAACATRVSLSSLMESNGLSARAKPYLLISSALPCSPANHSTCLFSSGYHLAVVGHENTSADGDKNAMLLLIA